MGRSSRLSGSSVGGHRWCPPPRHTVIIDDLSDVFDGAMITLAMLVLNVFHPGIYLQDPDHSTPSRTGLEEFILEDRLKTSPLMMMDRSSSVSRDARVDAMPSTSA